MKNVFRSHVYFITFAVFVVLTDGPNSPKIKLNFYEIENESPVRNYFKNDISLKIIMLKQKCIILKTGFCKPKTKFQQSL